MQIRKIKIRLSPFTNYKNGKIHFIGLTNAWGMNIEKQIKF